MKRLGVLFILLLTILLVAGFSACSKESPYAADIVVMEDTCRLIYEFIQIIDGSKNANGLGLAIIDFIPKYTAIKPQLDELEKKYPYFGRTGGEENAPKELKPYLKRVREAYEMLRIVVDSNATKWRRDEGVMIAVRELKGIIYQ